MQLLNIQSPVMLKSAIPTTQCCGGSFVCLLDRVVIETAGFETESYKLRSGDWCYGEAVRGRNTATVVLIRHRYSSAGLPTGSFDCLSRVSDRAGRV